MTDIKYFDTIELIRALSLEFGPSGCEDRVRNAIRARVEKYADSLTVDRLGNLICKMSFGDRSSPCRIMICAHMDEVGFMIDGIRSDGMLTFGCVGGISPEVLAGRKVTVCGKEGILSGLICSKAIHHKEKEEREKAVAADKLFIDIGCSSKEEAEKKISVGDLGTFDSEFVCFGKDMRTVKCKALDDRMGCAAMIQIMERFKSEPPHIDADVFFCFTVREEIGYSGAGIAAELTRPELAIVLETTAICDLPNTEAHRRVADVGCGGVISVADRSTVYDREVVDYALSLAKEKGIKAQIKRYVSGGNDAGNIHKRLTGIKTVAISVPTRYLHSPACVASVDDFEAVRELAMAIIEDKAKQRRI